jgi:hypothetical protein
LEVDRKISHPPAFNLKHNVRNKKIKDNYGIYSTECKAIGTIKRLGDVEIIQDCGAGGARRRAVFVWRLLRSMSQLS